MAQIVLNPNQMTLLDAKKDVARVLGNASDPANQTLAGDCIRDVLQDLNNARDWRWMQNITTDVTVATQATVAIPARTKKIVDVLVNNRTLMYVDQHDWDRQLAAGTQINVGGVLFYTMFDFDATATIVLRDTPSVSGQPIVLKFVRLIDYPTADGNKIDLPESAMTYVLSKSKADYIARVNGGSEKLDFFTNQAKERYMKLLSDDTRKPDEEITFMPGYLYPTPLNPNYDYDYVYWD